MNRDPEKRVRLVVVAILSLGLSAALLIYRTAPELDDNPLGDQLDNSKAYLRSIELYGGKANLLATQFTRWFGALWHGKSLAFTVAVISLLVALLYYFLATPPPPEEK
jgi:hypothetical protein